MSVLAPGLLKFLTIAIDIGNAAAAVPFNRAGPSEVRLPQELRFTDDRRSTFGDIPLARRCARAPKSSGRNWFHTSSRLLCTLQLPAAAILFRSDLYCLLDRNPIPF